VADERLRVACFEGEFRSEQPGPPLQPQIPLWAKRVDRVVGMSPSGVRFAGEQLDHGEIQQGAGHTRSVVNRLAASQGKPSDPSPFVVVAGRSGQQTEVGQAQVRTAPIPEVLADPQCLAQVFVGRIEQALVAFDASEVVERKGQAGSIVKFREDLGRPTHCLEGAVEIAGEPVDVGEPRKRVPLRLHGVAASADQPGLLED
jgi:hypothetical protein